MPGPAAIPGVISEEGPPSTTHRDALQALLAFSSLHDQVRRRRALAHRSPQFDNGARTAEFEQQEQFVLDEILQLVAERAIAITGADGLAIALAENSEIVLRASAGTIRPDVGTRIDRSSAFSGACFRSAQVVRCDDSELDPRVNLRACRKLGARSMVAVPLCGRKRVIGVLEAFAAEPFGFNDSDVRNLTLLAELVLGALKPEDEERFADSAQAAAGELGPSLAAEITVKNVPEAAVIPESLNGSRRITGDVDSIRSMFASAGAQSALPDAPEKDEKESASPVSAQAKQSELRTPAEETPVAARSGNYIFVFLGVIVVAALVAVGVWWKLNSAQVAEQMVTAAPANGENNTASRRAAPANTVAPGTPSTNQRTAAAIETDSGTISVTPATPQELAKFPKITAIRHWSSGDSSTVVLDLEDQVQYETHRLSKPDRIYVDLHDTTLAPDLAAKTIDIGDSLISRVRIAQPIAGMTRVVLETKGNPNSSVSLEPNPYRLVLEVRKIGAEQKGSVNLFPDTGEQKPEVAIVVPPPTKEDLQWRARVPKMRIVIDAGHGGWDLGTVGRRGLLEKDVCLEVAERLGKLLQSRLGWEIVYTRQDDNYIPLDQRAEIANQAQADLFVSVHANYSDLPSARGVETYYTNSFSAPALKDADAHDKSATASAPSLSTVELHDRIEQSRHLAASVQRSLYGGLSARNPGLRDRGVKQAGFVVLTETAIPGILAEVSFVSSPTDEQKLRSDGYREQIAEALYKGIARYAAAARTVKVASASD